MIFVYNQLWATLFIGCGRILSCSGFINSSPLHYPTKGQIFREDNKGNVEMCWFYMGIAQIALVAGNNKSQKGPSLRSILEFLFAGDFHVFIRLKI